ncbi:MAG: FAD-dependent oxidoreductase [Gemmatimonadales bacterium]
MAKTHDMNAEVLVVGAGPTGLVLALWLARRGVAVRIIDKTAEPGTTSRALAVQARTLEFYRQLGLADDAVRRGLPFAAINLWARGKHAGRAAFGDVGEGLSPYPYLLILPQEEHERLLIEHLERTGVHVERRTELTGFIDHGDRVEARLRVPDGRDETCTVAWLAGCDGASSPIREELGLRFPGGTYQHIYYVADVRASGPITNHELHVALDDSDFLAVFPLQGEEKVRLVGTIAEAAIARGTEPTWDDVSTRAMKRLGITVHKVNWFSTYHVHHRVVEHFRTGRVFLAGDAAHIHSPVGGQGMNTGIGDAVNLAWKFAAVVQGRAAPDLLDRYEPERIRFARRLVKTTDQVFVFTTRNGPIARLMRFYIIPTLVPWLLQRRAVRRFMFRTVSQTLLDYRHSDWSEGRAGSVHGGDRLPWAATPGVDNFAPLSSLDWQIHVYGQVPSGLAEAAGRHGICVNTFKWNETMARNHLAPNTAYLIRPDGYVAIAGASAKAVDDYFERHQVKVG